MQRSTRSHENPSFNSDSPRKRTRYTSVTLNGARRPSANATPRSRGLRTPRAQEQEDDAFLTSGATQARRITSPDKPRYDSAADAAAAATGQMDGYKPREERSWEEFHQDLNLEAQITVFSADEVDGIQPTVQNGRPDRRQSPVIDGHLTGSDNEYEDSAAKRRGRPPRRPESMLNGLGSPPAPKVVPIPAHNPREKLNLPKPSYRMVETFEAYEADRQSKSVNYVDKALANVGFQEWENFTRTGQQFLRHMEDSWQDDREPRLATDVKQNGAFQQQTYYPSRVEYDMDEQDEQWLEAHNTYRKDTEQVEGIRPPVFEITMTQIEKEWHALERRIPKPNPKPPQTHRPRSSSAAAVNGEPAGAGEEQDTKCAICDDGDCENTNAIVFCDGCDVAVHQECYGIPYIPEGQWQCRKCQIIGTKSKPVCIFCPNFGGAFKQTTENRWAHLLCAIWIPEVSIANQTFMEPISDVSVVPRERWDRLICYICNQKMGACIQCGHRSCYIAFHVTCAKKGKLYLRQKSSHGTGTNMDASVLKAFCHKHVSPEWQAEHDSERAVLRAQAYYKKRMRNIEWADSMTSATTALTSQALQPLDMLDENAEREDSKGQNNIAALKRKRQAAQKSVWKLQSGAPIVPDVVQEAVEVSLQRFNVRKRKEFVAEACKYWTMKRDSRRGAAMLKRLQLQLETFSANEVTRRNFAAMGHIGASRLERRVEMAERLLGEIATVQRLCAQVRTREGYKLQDVELLRSLVDTMYFPVSALLEPVLRVARSLDRHNAFAAGSTEIQRKIDRRIYGSAVELANDLGLLFPEVPGLEGVRDVSEAHSILAASMPREEHLSETEKELKKLAKRMAKAVQQPLREALLREAELGGDLYDKRLQEMRQVPDKEISEQAPQHVDELLAMLRAEQASSSGTQTVVHECSNNVDGEPNRPSNRVTVNGELDPEDASASGMATTSGTQVTATSGIVRDSQKRLDHKSTDDTPLDSTGEPHKLEESSLFLSIGGTPWYLEHFGPRGTSVQEEKWFGPDVFRGLSEELSEMDEEELRGLGQTSEADVSPEPVTHEPALRPSRKTRRHR